MKSLKFLLFLISLFLVTLNSLAVTVPVSTSVVIPVIPINIGDFSQIKPEFGEIYNSCNPVKISSDNVLSAYNPEVYENMVAWQKGDYIYLWKDGSAKKTSVNTGSIFIDLNDNKIIYTYHYRMFLYDIITKENSIVNNSSYVYNFSYDNNNIAYIESGKIYYLSNNISKLISRCSYNMMKMHNGSIVWVAYDNLNHTQIYFWNGNNILQITTNNKTKRNPDIYDNKIVWGAYDGGGDLEIFYWDGTNIIQITDNDYNDYNPKIYNGKIVWYGYKNGNSEIFYWNGTDIIQVTNNNEDDRDPDIYNGRIAWKRKGTDIYTCVVDPPKKPAAITNYATNKTVNSAKLNGKANPNEQETEYRFDYGKTTSYSMHTSWKSIGNGKTIQYVSETITGLDDNTTYHFRIVAKNPSGTSYGSDKTFKTLAPTPVLPTVTTDNATETEPYILSATINPNGFDTTFYFEYGTDTNYNNKTPESGAGSGETNITVTAQLSGLQPNTTYHYRIVAENAAGIVKGNDKTFTTPAIIESMIPIPSGLNQYPYLPVETPILSVDPSEAKPFAVGNLLAGNLNLQVGLKGFENPVDIYLAITFDKIPGKIFFIDSANELKQTVATWKTGHTDKINDVSLYGNISTSNLPKGIYTLYLLVVPAGATNMDNSYLWVTNFTISR